MALGIDSNWACCNLLRRPSSTLFWWIHLCSVFEFSFANSALQKYSCLEQRCSQDSRRLWSLNSTSHSHHWIGFEFKHQSWKHLRNIPVLCVFRTVCIAAVCTPHHLISPGWCLTWTQMTTSKQSEHWKSRNWNEEGLDQFNLSGAVAWGVARTTTVHLLKEVKAWKGKSSTKSNLGRGKNCCQHCGWQLQNGCQNFHMQYRKKQHIPTEVWELKVMCQRWSLHIFIFHHSSGTKVLTNVLGSVGHRASQMGVSLEDLCHASHPLGP